MNFKGPLAIAFINSRVKLIPAQFEIPRFGMSHTNIGRLSKGWSPSEILC